MKKFPTMPLKEAKAKCKEINTADDIVQDADLITHCTVAIPFKLKRGKYFIAKLTSHTSAAEFNTYYTLSFMGKLYKAESVEECYMKAIQGLLLEVFDDDKNK